MYTYLGAVDVQNKAIMTVYNCLLDVEIHVIKCLHCGREKSRWQFKDATVDVYVQFSIFFFHCNVDLVGFVAN